MPSCAFGVCPVMYLCILRAYILESEDWDGGLRAWLAATKRQKGQVAKTRLPSIVWTSSNRWRFVFARSFAQAYIQETLAFCDCLVNDKPSPCSGEDGLMALVMAIAAGVSAEEGRWVR